MNTKILNYKIEYLCNGMRCFYNVNTFDIIDINVLTTEEIEDSIIFQTKKDNKIKKTDDFKVMSIIQLEY